MQKMHCDGCPHTEDENVGKDERKIYRVKFFVIEDPRFPEGAKQYEADLCVDCQGQVLHNYFRVTPEGSMRIPAFLVEAEPVGSRRAGSSG